MNGCKVGIEVEVEEYSGLTNLKDWAVVGEAMLINGAEFVLREPLAGAKLSSAVKTLCGKLTTEVFTQRCSVHIHVDVREFTHLERMKFITLYTMFEPLLMTLLKEGREGNVFCLPIAHSHQMEEALIKLSTGVWDFDDIGMNNYKYGSINLASVSRLGSLEFRALHGTGDADEILRWVRLHTAIAKFAKKFKGTPADMVTSMSITGTEEMCVAVLGDDAIYVNDADALLYKGARNAQFFAYTGNW
jgi:hypothetical protein